MHTTLTEFIGMVVAFLRNSVVVAARSEERIKTVPELRDQLIFLSPYTTLTYEDLITFDQQ